MLRRLAMLAAAVILALPAPPARAQDAAADPRLLRLASITPWTDAERSLRAELQVTNTSEVALSGASVRIAVYGRVLSRSQLQLALGGRHATTLVAATTEAIEEPIPPGAQHTLVIERRMQDLAVRRTGVYPIEFTLQFPGGEETLITGIPFVAGPVTSPINITWIAPLTRPTALRPEGVYDHAGLAALDLAGLQQQAEALASAPSKMSLAPSAALLDTLADLADGFVLQTDAGPQTQGETSPVAAAAAAALEAMRRAAASAGEVVSAPYTTVDLPTMAARGLRADLLRQLTRSRTTVESHLDVVPNAGVLYAPAFRLDDRSAAAIAPLGVQAVTLDAATLPAQPTQPFSPQLFGPSRPVTVGKGNARTTALLVDPGFRALLEQPGQGAAQAQAIIASTAIAWLELPALASERLLVLSSRRLPPPTALRPLLDGLRDAPWTTMRTAGEALTAVPPQGQALALPLLAPRERPYLAAARAARRALSTLTTLSVDPLPDAELLEREVLLAASTEWHRARSQGAALARAVIRRADEVMTRVTVPPRQVTLTSSTGAVPVTIVNRNPFTVRVRLRLQSAKIVLTGSSTRIVEVPEGDATVDFAVEARAAGAFPLEVRVDTTDGGALVTTGRVVVRSTAVSRVTLAATAGSALFLLLAWVRRDARRRRARAGA